jgi:pimeloyl-ACP methyl ester carboxylesterase
MTLELVEIRRGNVTLRGQRWPGDPLTVVLLHEPGEDNDLDRWRPLIPYLLGNGATVLAIDLRGHGASDGDWSPAHEVDDAAAAVSYARQRGAMVVVCAAGESALAALRAAEVTRVDGLILLSPICDTGDPPRGPGTPKLLFAGGRDEEARDYAVQLRAASIGPALSVSLPTAERGTALIEGTAAATCREHIVAFLNERRREFALGSPSAGAIPDQFLERLGIRPKGVDG